MVNIEESTKRTERVRMTTNKMELMLPWKPGLNVYRIYFPSFIPLYQLLFILTS